MEGKKFNCLYKWQYYLYQQPQEIYKNKPKTKAKQTIHKILELRSEFGEVAGHKTTHKKSVVLQ